MDLYQSLAGLLRLELTSADIASTLSAFNNNSIPVSEISQIDDVTIHFTVRRSDLKRVRLLSDRRGERLRIIKRFGLIWKAYALARRPVLLTGLVMLLMMGIILPGRILFISVEGNDSIPARMILESAEKCGIRFGASRRMIRSEEVKNMLLDELPKLKWAGVNTYGCRAVITVREKNDTTTHEESFLISHIAASRDGIITSCTASKGTPLCEPGQAVKAGDILISGYTDCGLTIITGRAEGDVFAETRRDLKAVTPSISQFRGECSKSNIRYSLIIGKKRINFYKGSGISGGSCVKMSMKYVLTLPGGFTLPVAMVKETIAECSLTQQISDQQQHLRIFAENYLKSQMVAGSVLQRNEQVEEADGLTILTGSYVCLESIGRFQEEKIGEQNGKTDGTDRERGSSG